MEQIDYLQSDDKVVVVTPLTADYSESIYEIIEQNRDYLNNYAFQSIVDSNTFVDLQNSTENPQASITERYVILSRGIIAGSVSLTQVADESDVVELDFWVAEKHTRQGLASTAAQLLTDDLLKGSAIREVIAYAQSENIACHNTLVKAGFKLHSITEDKNNKYVKNLGA
jgi:RimJ/RimL family protein N-acetyltransferase